MSEKIGIDCRLLINTGSWDTPTWEEITAVRDVSLSSESAEADLSARGDTFKAFEQGQVDLSIDITAVYREGDAKLKLLRDAHLARTGVELWMASGADDATGTEGLRAFWKVLNWGEEQPQEDASTVTFSLKPAREPGDNDPEYKVVS